MPVARFVVMDLGLDAGCLPRMVMNVSQGSVNSRPSREVQGESDGL